MFATEASKRKSYGNFKVIISIKMEALIVKLDMNRHFLMSSSNLPP